MSTNYLALRSSAAPTLTVSTLLGSTISTRSISFQSTTISLGQSTNQSYTNFSNGSFTTGWASTLTGLTSIKEVVLSPNGSVQTILQNTGSTMSTVITSANSGITWAGSTMRGLPTSGALPYQTYGSTINTMPVPSITAITAAPSGTNQLAIASNELVYASANSGATFAATGLGQNNSPFIYIPFDGSVTDVMGNSVVTATGSPAYVAGKVGTNAVNLANATPGGTATQYLRGTWTGSNSFTVSFWFNAQTLLSGTGQIELFMTYNGGYNVYINSTNNIVFVTSGSVITSSTILSTNTWYNVIAIGQVNGLCSLYLNNSLVGSGTNSGGFGTNTGVFGLGTADLSAILAFNGYIDDFRLYNYAVTNPSGAALINPIVGPIMPFVYLTFDGSTTTDVMGNSTVTATGSPGYVVGQVGSNAIYFANAGTGSNPTQYLTGTVSGLGNAITFSCWFQALILPSSGAETVWGMNAVTTGAIIVQFSIATTGIVSFQYYNGSSWQAVYSTSAISLNTWYHAVCIYQGAGTFSLYLNGALTTNTGSGVITPAIASYTIGGANASPVTPTFGFRGYVDDFRIYTGAFTPSQLSPVLYSPSHAIGSPNIYLPFENGSVLDVMGYSAVSARGTMNFVPGVVGTSALNLVNPAGGTAVNYVRGSWAGSANFTVSFWFNAQTLGVSQQVLFSAYAGNYVIYLNSSNRIVIYLPSGGAGLNALTGPVISINTWYYVTATFQTNGSCALYVNNSLIGSYTNSGGVGSYISTAFSTGTYDTTAIIESFNGYIDDFKIYNCAVPFHALGPMNYTQAAISNSGAYQVVAAANGGVYTSANSGSTWSQATLASLAVISEVDTVGGQVITPQLTGLTSSGTTLTTAPWVQNGVTWVASASSVFSSIYAVSNIFNNTLGANNGWANSSANYTSSGNTASQTTTIQGVGITTGEWAQIQSSVPLVMTSYQFATGSSATSRLPKTYYIVGSNDGSTWYLIQYGAGAALTTTPVGTLVPGTIIVYNTGTSVVQTFGSSTITTSAYSTASNAYTYFRMVFLSIYGAVADYVDFGEWFINFATPPTPLYVAPSTALIANQSLNAITVMPQQRGLIGAATATWTTNGVSWVASASSAYASTYYAYMAFDNFGGAGNGWVTGTTNYTTTPLTSGTSTTVLGGIGTVYGEWIQIQSSVPLVMSTYQLGFGGTPLTQLPRSFYIVGSVDGTNWYPLQYAVGAAVPGLNPFVLVDVPTIVNSTSTQIWGTSTLATISYSTSANAYTYFRIIVTSTFTTSAATYAIIGEWAINFTAYTPALIQSLSMSPSGQYIALTGAGATTPNLTGLAANTWSANGVSWTASSAMTGLGQPYNLFDNNISSGWRSEQGYAANGSYPGGRTTTVQGVIGIVYGCSVDLQVSTPVILQSYTYACIAPGNLPKIYYIVGSNDGSTWFPIQYVFMTTNPCTASNTVCTSNILVNFTGTQVIQGNQAGSGSTTSYPTSTTPYLYFRIIGNTLWPTDGFFGFAELYLNFQSGPTFYSTDYGSSWTRSLTAATIPNANVLATSGNGQYSLQASGQTVMIANNTSGGNPTGSYTTPTFSPALSSATGAVSNAAVSATGQYMVVLTQGSSNNVYYSSNYGVSFTGITLGSSAMVSCAVSADGSYITVANQTQVFTLNSNTQGLSITVGNQSGLTNQGQNAVAIGNQAGQINQSANSIVLNSSGTAVNAYVPGFFVAPVQSSGSSVSGSFAVLGYGTDNQVVQTGMTMMSNGNMGIGATNPAALLEFGRGAGYDGSGGTNQIGFSWNGSGGGYRHWIISRHNSAISNTGNAIDFYLNNSVTANGSVGPTNGSILGMSVTGAGVGIGTTAPGAPLHVVGSGGAGNPLRLVSNTAGNEVAIGFYRNPDQSAPITGDLWVAGIKSFGSGDRNFCIGCSGTNNILTMLATGTVGIGATAPGTGFSTAIPNAKLTILSGAPGQVNGKSRISIGGDASHYAAIEGEHTGSGSTTLSFMTCLNASTNSANPETRMVIANNGNVSVYNQLFAANALTSLGTVQGNTLALMQIGSGGSGAYGRLVFYGNRWTGGSDWQSTSIILRYEVDATNFQVVGFNSLGVGIGVTSPGYHLHLGTDSAAKPSTNTWTVASDERLKDNITLADIDRCVEIIRAVPLKHYRWRDEVYTLEQVKDRSKLGWIAQDVEKVFPKAVNTHVFRYNQVYEDVVKEDGSTEKRVISEDVLDDCRDLNADQLYAVMYGAIQKLIVENDAQKATNTELTQKLDFLLAWAQTQGYS